MYGQLSHTVHHQTREPSTNVQLNFFKGMLFKKQKTLLDAKSENWSTYYKNMSELPSSTYSK